MDIPGLVRAARYETTLNQKHFAKRVGIAPSTLSRIESGAALPSLVLLERILATCGRDAHWQLVDRHADLDAVLDACAQEAPLDRLSGVDARCRYFAVELTTHGALLGGAWAAALHGLPCEHRRGRAWLPGDDATVTAVATLFRRHLVCRVENDRPAAVSYDAGLLRRYPDEVWRLMPSGDFRLNVVQPGEPWPGEVRLDTEDGPLRVLRPEELTPEDGVRTDVLDRWLSRRLSPAAR